MNNPRRTIKLCYAYALQGMPILEMNNVWWICRFLNNGILRTSKSWHDYDMTNLDLTNTIDPSTAICFERAEQPEMKGER